MVAGIWRSRWTFATSTTAWLSDTPGARLNEIVTDGSWPRCVMVSGPMVGVSFATELSGTSFPDCARTYSSDSSLGSRWYRGSSSRMTQYWLVGV